jgi:hypothetical protein
MVCKSALLGCFEPLKMSFDGFLMGANKRTMHGAFNSGALQYRVLVARKPALSAGKAHKLPPLNIFGSDAKLAAEAAAIVEVSAEVASEGSGSRRESGRLSGSSSEYHSDCGSPSERDARAPRGGMFSAWF